MHASNELVRVEAQLRAIFEGPAWHGPAVLELLTGEMAGECWYVQAGREPEAFRFRFVRSDSDAMYSGSCWTWP